MKTYKPIAEVAWTAHDIKTLQPKWSLRKCQAWLEENETYIQDEIIQKGHEVLESLLWSE